MPLRVDLVFDEGCPHVERARDNLRAALRQAGLPQVWVSWRRSDRIPDRYRGYGSPTVLVQGRDVTGMRGVASGPACVASGAPATASIADAIARALAGNGELK